MYVYVWLKFTWERGLRCLKHGLHGLWITAYDIIKKNNEISLFANAVHNCKMFASVGQIFIDISLENCKPIYRKSLVTSKFWSINMQKEHRLQSALEFLETIEVTVWSPLPCRFSLCRYRLSLCQSTLIRSKTVSILCCCTI